MTIRAHCRHLAILRWPEEASRAPDIRKLVERERFKANLLRPGAPLNWQGGSLALTDDELAFVPHSLNFGPLERAILPLRSIKSLELTTGLVSDELTLTDDRGERWGVRVFRGKVVRDAIEKARALLV